VYKAANFQYKERSNALKFSLNYSLTIMNSSKQEKSTVENYTSTHPQVGMKVV
jgi:hypothetical protein